MACKGKIQLETLICYDDCVGLACYVKLILLGLIGFMTPSATNCMLSTLEFVERACARP